MITLPEFWANVTGAQMPASHLVALRTSTPIGNTCPFNGPRAGNSVERLYSPVAPVQ